MMRGTSTVDIWASFVDGPHIRLSVPGTAFASACRMANRSSCAGGSGMEMEAKRWDTESGKMIAADGIAVDARNRSRLSVFVPRDGYCSPTAVKIPSSCGTSNRDGRFPIGVKALMPDWGPIAGDPAGSPKSGAPPAFVTAENTGREIQSGGQVPPSTCRGPAMPSGSFSPTGLWTDIPGGTARGNGLRAAASWQSDISKCRRIRSA